MPLSYYLRSCSVFAPSHAFWSIILDSTVDDKYSSQCFSSNESLVLGRIYVVRYSEGKEKS